MDRHPARPEQISGTIEQGQKTAALFSETQARILVTVCREDDVKFVGLCEQRNIPITRIGVTDSSPTLEIQNLATCQLTDLKSALDATLPELFS